MTFPDWFSELVSEELARLYALSLEGCPGADVLEITIRSWTDDLYAHLQHAVPTIQQDRARMQVAFRQLRLNSQRWPTPRGFLNYLPPRKPAKAIARQTHSITREEQARRIIRIETDRAAQGLKPLELVLEDPDAL